MGAARPAPCSHAARLGAPRPWPGRSAKSSSSSAAAGSSHGSGAPSVSRLCLSAAPAVDLERGPRGCPGPEPPGSLVGSRTGRRGGDAEGRGLQPGAAPPNASPAVGAGMRGPQDPSRSGPSPPRPRMRPVALVQVQRGLSAERDLQTPQAGAEELRNMKMTLRRPGGHCREEGNAFKHLPGHGGRRTGVPHSGLCGPDHRWVLYVAPGALGCFSFLISHL
uniref:translation initiation factor IF-2-like isoform X3 n=1 Tax=Callithrix jacchus TaxID=9483 RepID=UPI0023DCF31E|nr:translation initiation factor IF-2-like isoform X3 [Callithrix jacchus]